MISRLAPSLLILGALIAPFTVSAAADPLSTIYSARPDLQKAFDAKTGLAKSTKAGILIDLTDWAKQDGWKEYPKELASYAPKVKPPTPGKTAAPTVTASSYIVIDESSGEIIAASHADTVWPVASISKLMTSQVALADGLSMSAHVTMKASDNVGGAALATKVGTVYTVSDLFTAMLLGSANNAATAIGRAAGGSNFVSQMNARAAELHLTHTHFNDPSGMDPGNVSTARELAVFADAAFNLDPVRTRATSAQKIIYAVSTGEKHVMKNTDWMLTQPAYNDVYVTSGKTGFLDESGWNFVVRMRPSASAKSKEILVVVFGAASRGDSFNDAQKLGEWVWGTFKY